MKSDRLNILTIMTDQHSSHVMGCYGNKIVRTPNLDRLAAEGMNVPYGEWEKIPRL